MIRIILGIFISFVVTISNADVYPNPYLTDPSLATTFASKLRNLKYNDMQSLISNECDQFKNFSYLSATNWYEYLKNRKTLDEAQQYSNMLLTQFPDQQAQLFTFPFGYETLKTIDDNTKNLLSNGSSITQAVSLQQSYCIYALAPIKNFTVTTNPEYLYNNQKIDFLSNDKIMQLVENNKKNSLITMVFDNNAHSEKALSQKEISKLKLTPKGLIVVGVLLQDDISKLFMNTDIRWIDYMNFYNQQVSTTINFYEHGGNINQYYFMILCTAKALELESNNFQDINIYNPSELQKIFNKATADSKIKEAMKRILHN